MCRSCWLLGLIALISEAMSLIGLELGQQLGVRIEQGSEVFGGIVLILAGFAYAFGWL
jgi:putative Mn2+ efflux pump MntP